MFGESLVVDYYSTYEISMSLNVVDVQFSIYNGLTICLGFKFLYLGRICLELYFMKNTCCCQCIMDDSLHWGLLPLNCLQQNKQNPSSHAGYSPGRYTCIFGICMRVSHLLSFPSFVHFSLYDFEDQRGSDFSLAGKRHKRSYQIVF